MSGRIWLVVGAFLALRASALAEDVAGPPQHGARSSLLTLGGAYTVEAGGCERHSRSFRISARRPIDVARTGKGQVVSGVYLRERDRTGRAGWRNVSVSPDGRSIDFELYAEGTGRFRAVPTEGRQCVESQPARVIVDVDAWVVDP
jgi:hypothetical protein